MGVPNPTAPKRQRPRPKPKPAVTVYEHISNSSASATWEDDQFSYIRVDKGNDERISHFEERKYEIVPEGEFPAHLPHIKHSRRRLIMRFPKKVKQDRYRAYNDKMNELAGLADAAGAEVREDLVKNDIRKGNTYSASQIADKLPESVDTKDFSEVEDLIADA